MSRSSTSIITRNDWILSQRHCDNVLIQNKIGNFVCSLQNVQISDYDVVQGKLSLLSGWLNGRSKAQECISEVCVKTSVSDIVAYKSLSSLEIQHYAFQAVNVMTTCLYPITPESIQSSGGEALAWLCFTWLGIERAFLNPQGARNKFAKNQTAWKHAIAVVICVSAGACVCVCAQCIPAFMCLVCMFVWRGVNDRGLR